MLVGVFEGTPHHVAFVRTRKSAVISHDVRVSSRTISEVVKIFWVLSAQHRLFDRREESMGCFIWEKALTFHFGWSQFNQ